MFGIATGVESALTHITGRLFDACETRRAFATGASGLHLAFSHTPIPVAHSF
jgi:hypothetical protein